MDEKSKTVRYKSDKQCWYLYMLRCGNKSLYTGITNDLEKRLKMHQAGKAAKYTRMFPPVKLVYDEKCKNRTKALVRECKVKCLSKKEKEKMVRSSRRGKYKQD